jgi:hypothetical protein
MEGAKLNWEAARHVGPGQDTGEHVNNPYEIANQKVLTGTVLDVPDYQCPVTGTVGSHITVRHAGGTIETHLAPAKFLKQYEIVINKGSQVQIEGAMTTVEGKPAMLAKILADGHATYAFRDAKGKPLW